jgi:hypothetical protein
MRFGENRERHDSLSKFQANKHIVNETGDSAAPFRFGPVRLRLRGKKMKAQLKPRINLEGRTTLETFIPLSTPFVVFVDPASSCNFRGVISDSPANWYLATQCLPGGPWRPSDRRGADAPSKGTLAHFESAFPEDPSLARLAAQLRASERAQEEECVA